MANTLGIVEVTLAQVSDVTHTINLVDPTGAVDASPRKSVYQPIICRVTDHADNDAAEVGTDTDKMAIFRSQRHGEPWVKDFGTEHILATVGVGATGTVSETGGVIDTPVVTAGGVGYYPANTIAVFGGGGTGAAADITVVDGVITSFVMTNGGTGYTTPTVTFSSPAPTNVTVLFPNFDYSTFE